MKNEVDVSILINTYNHEKYIARALDSVLNQETQYNYEILVVDDASTDSTPQIIEKYTQKHPNKIIAYLLKKNIGLARLAIFEAKPDVRGRYWIKFDGDDYWKSKIKIQKQLSFMDKNSDFIATNHGCLVIDDNGNETNHTPDLEEWSIEEMICMAHQHTFYAHTSTWVWRNQYQKECGFFWPSQLKEKHTFGDVCLSTWLLKEGGKVKTFMEPMTCYNYSGKGAWSKRTARSQWMANMALCDRQDIITNYKYTEALKRTKNRLWRYYYAEKFPLLAKIYRTIRGVVRI